MLPINTDAPIYHWPIATVALIVVNTLVFVAMLVYGFELVEPWVLHFGVIHPLQWVTSMFLHGDWLHIIGNMLALWGLGLVVEGKLGWWRFVIVYLLIGVVEAAAVQLIMLPADAGGALGASGAIYGLIAIALVWAPKNELTCVFFFSINTLNPRTFLFDISILTFSAIQIGWQLAIAHFSSYSMSSAMLHLGGALIGGVLAVVMLKRGMVDCENWDIFAVWQDRAGQSKEQIQEERETPAERAARALEHRRSLWRRVHDLVERGQPLEAYQLYENLRPTLAEGDLDRKDFDALVRGLHKAELWASLVPLLVEYLKRFPAGTERMRLLLAQILLREEKRPNQALAVLAKLNATPLPPKLEQARRQLIATAKKMQADGAIEFQIQDW